MAIEHESQPQEQEARLDPVEQEPTECLEKQENVSQDQEQKQQEVMDYLRQSRENGWSYER